MAEKKKEAEKKRKKKRAEPESEGQVYNVNPAEKPVKGPTGKDVYRM